MSVCSSTSKLRLSLKPRIVSNKENEINENKKVLTSNKLSNQMNEIKKVLMSNDDSDSKIYDINKIVYGAEHSMIQC